MDILARDLIGKSVELTIYFRGGSASVSGVVKKLNEAALSIQGSSICYLDPDAPLHRVGERFSYFADLLPAGAA